MVAYVLQKSEVATRPYIQILLKGWELVKKWITMRVSNQFDAPFYVTLGAGTFNTNKNRLFA